MSALRLNPLDASWLYTESRETPMHVGALMPFKLPDDAPPDFLRQLMSDLRKERRFEAPWNRRLKSTLLKSPVHHWIEDEDIDIEAHLRHTALPWPGGERELGELIARLHSQPLDLSRPPWECTLIEGLEGDRFALYIKMHHSLIDGVSGAKLLQRVMATERDKSLTLLPFWAVGSSARPGGKEAPERDTRAPTFANALAGAVEALRGQVGTVPQLLFAFGKMLRFTKDADTDLRIPFGAPGATINGRVRAKRRFATQQFPLERMKTLAAAADCTLNDIVLAICGGALRRFLDDSGDLPAAALTAGIPVSVRPEGRRRHGQRHHLHHRHAGHRHRRPDRAPRCHPCLGQGGQGARAEPAARGDDPVHDRADGAHHLDAVVRAGRARASGVQHHHFQRAGSRQALVLPRRGAVGQLSGVGRHPRSGVEHHVPQLRRSHGVRLHRLPQHAAAHAAHRGLHRRSVRGIGKAGAQAGAQEAHRQGRQGVIR